MERSPHDALKFVHPKPFKMSFKCELGGLPIPLFSTFKILYTSMWRSPGPQGIAKSPHGIRSLPLYYIIQLLLIIFSN